MKTQEMIERAKSTGYNRAQVMEYKGHSFKVWSNFIERATYAENEDGEVMKLSGSGYIKAQATVRRALRIAYSL